MLKFVPDAEEKKSLPRYASYTPGTMKTHGGIGFAKNSLNNRMWTYQDTDEVLGEKHDGSPRYKKERVTVHAALLELVEGEYFVLYDIPAGTKPENLPWMKEYIRSYSYGDSQLYSEYHKRSPYYQEQIEKGAYRIFKKATPMTTDEYVDWRLEVERERIVNKFTDKQIERLRSQ